MKTIALTKGRVALVDDSDFDEVSKFKWYYSSHGYVARTEVNPKRVVYLHRMLMSPPNGMMMDHKNGDKLDNRRCNLRVCTNSQNCANKTNKFGCTSKYRGVYRHPRGWCVNIRHNKKRTYVGLFQNEIEAAQAYDRAATKLQGEFAVLNFPNESSTT